MESLFATEPIEEFKTISQEILDNLCGNEKTIDHSISNAIEGAKQDIKQMIIDSNYDMDKVAAVLKTKSSDQDKVTHFLTLLEQRRVDLLYALLTHGNSAHGESLLNFNWVLKLVLGSSELKSLKYPLVQLMFNTKTANGKDNQTMYELNKESLFKFISIIETIE